MGTKKIRSFLDEMDRLLPHKDKNLIIEARANHIITSSINMVQLIKENYPADQADELINRFYLAIKNSNPRKFQHGIKKIKDIDNE